MKHTMLDLETMGASSGAAIMSIGAVEFDLETTTLGREFYVNVDLASCLKLGLRVDASTLMWWLEQDEAARKSLLDHRENIYVALTLFKKWLDPETTLWANGASFDFPILNEAYRLEGMEKPWNFRNERDARTIYRLNNIKVENLGTHHNALDDAKAQARTLIHAFELMDTYHP